MCGIVGYVGGRPCRDILIAGLEKLEYRGYDSAGVSLLDDGHIETVRAVGNLANLRIAVEEAAAEGGAVAVAEEEATIGLAHTRWATHGRVTEANAHPHGDCADSVHIVLNGIVENHSELRRELRDDGHIFTSETDAEIVAHLIERHSTAISRPPSAPRSPTCAATTRSSRCMPSIPSCSSALARNAR